MKKIVLLLSVLLVITSCGKSDNNETGSGNIIKVSYEEFQKMRDENKTGMVILTQSTCGYCKQYFEDVVNPYLEDNPLTVYELVIDEESNPQVVWDKIQAEWKDFGGTPTTIIVKDGTVTFFKSGVLDEDTFKDLINNNKLLQK